ncbi:uncharacterized protein LOC135201193 [Macrobrachium nipponense]|uniref:uncharacterized protein LOC135201193 n=1 Tax=Macrobrachium nipponense TaxID=159736 RepID=UPI0030C88D99
MATSPLPNNLHIPFPSNPLPHHPLLLFSPTPKMSKPPLTSIDLLVPNTPLPPSPPKTNTPTSHNNIHTPSSLPSSPIPLFTPHPQNISNTPSLNNLHTPSPNSPYPSSSPPPKYSNTPPSRVSIPLPQHSLTLFSPPPKYSNTPPSITTIPLHPTPATPLLPHPNMWQHNTLCNLHTTTNTLSSPPLEKKTKKRERGVDGTRQPRLVPSFSVRVTGGPIFRHRWLGRLIPNRRHLSSSSSSYSSAVGAFVRFPWVF